MVKKPNVPESLQNLVDGVGEAVSPADVDTFGELQRIRDTSHRIRTIVAAWRDQQKQERQMRQRYATCLIVAMGVQAVVINVIFFLIGYGQMTFEPWTPRIFIMAVFSELAAMVFFIVKYLFRPTGDTVLELASHPEPRPKRR